MNAILITTMAFASAFLVAIAILPLVAEVVRFRLTVRSRLAELSTSGRVDIHPQLFKNLSQSTPSLSRFNWVARLRKAVDESGCTHSLGRLLAMSGIAGSVAFSCTYVLFQSWLFAACCFFAAGALPIVLVFHRRNQRTQKLCRQLPEALDVISRSIRAGQSLPAALQIVANDFSPPLSEEFSRCYEQQKLGMSSDISLRELACRTRIIELQIFAVGVLVQSRAGGNLAELMDSLSATVRKRLKLQGRIRSLTAEGRMQAVVLMALPAAAFLILIAIAPDYVAPLLEWPELLWATAGAQLIGALWIRRIAHFDH